MLITSSIVITAIVILNREIEAVKKYSYVGCYETTNRSKILYQHVKKDDNISPRSCVDLCFSLQLVYAGLQKNECRCGQSQPHELIRRSYKECNYACPGDKKTACGGESKLSIYGTGVTATGDESIPARAYIGCYPDNDTDYRILKHSSHQYADNSPTKCHRICYQEGFRYFGLSDVKHCFCGDTPPFKENAVPDDNCQSLCNGDDKEFCGGSQKLSLYATGITNMQEYGRYVGCYSNPNLQDIKAEITLNLTKANSQGRCFNICDQRGFKYAGVQKGTLCLCLNKAPSISFKEDDNECDYEWCPGELTEEYCGGDNTMKVFRTRRTDEPEPVVVSYLGCYKDKKYFPTLDGHKEIFDKNLSPGLCIETCRFKGFSFSGVEFGTECHCSHSYPTIHAKVSDEECNVPCSGSSKDRCGGQFRIAVYDNGVPHPQVLVDKYYLGCYKDDVPGVKLLEGTSNDMQSYLSPTVCYKQCIIIGFPYFGVIANSEESEKCLCSEIDPAENLLTNDNECERKCNGDTTKVCGNDWRVAVYRTGLSDINSRYIYKGCFINDHNLLVDRQTFHYSNTLTPKRCFRLCNMLKFLYFGVQEGKKCRCGNDLSSSLTPESEDNCGIKCSGNASETCGGHEKYMQIYQIIRIEEEIRFGSPGQLLFSDNFNTLNTTNWSYTIKMANEPVIKNLKDQFHQTMKIENQDHEFVTYEKNNSVIYVKDDKLFIKPRPQTEEYTQSSITLQSCTGKPIECSKKAQSFYIIPPIQSGQLTTKHSFSFRYGKVEIRAKMPTGDWIVPEIWLVPTKYEYGDYYQSGQIRLAMIRGNKDLNCFDTHYGHKRLEMGVYLGHESRIKQKTFHKMASDSWSNNFHNYTVVWAPDRISFHVDGEEIGKFQPETDQTIRKLVGMPESSENLYVNATNKLAPFDREFHITFGISVGGLTDFDDNCVGNPKKPWTNTSPKAMLNFWRAKDQWSKTWIGESSALQIDHVKVWSL